MGLSWKRLFGQKTPAQELPPFWETYADAVRNTPPVHIPWEATRFVIFDTETTGLDPRKDRIISLGAVAVEGNTIYAGQGLECLIKPAIPSANAQIAVHGITPGAQETGISEAEALALFLGFIGNSVLVGHHISFDIDMINSALRRIGLPRLRNRSLDTIRLARRIAPPSATPREFNLSALCREYGIPVEDSHTAPGDALLTAILFLKLCTRLRQRGVHTLGGLLKRSLF